MYNSLKKNTVTKTYLIKHLDQIKNAKRKNRLYVANIVIKTKELFPYLIEIVFNAHDKTGIKAAWILELVCERKLHWILPYLTYFTENLKFLKHDSAIRPASKICMFLAQKQTSKNDFLTNEYIDNIIETGFDWMIGNHKVATKSYTMQTLYLLGQNTDWVHEALKLIIEQNIMNESAAYKARGRMTLNLINKK